MEPQLIDINDYILSGEGANGKSYDCISDKNLMVKMYNPSYPKEPIFSEYEVAKKVYDSGFPCPEPGELVTDGQRFGIKFHRIIGKRSYARAISEEPERLEEYVREFARFGKKLHTIKCPEGIFPDIKVNFRHMIESEKCYSDAEKAKILSFLESLPDEMTAIHGDFQIGNVVTTLPKGAPMEQPHDIYMIDLGYFSHGYPLLDLGILNITMNYLDADYSFQLFHLTRDLENKVWDVFVDEYFFGEEKLAEKYFGKGVTRKDVDEQLFKLMAIQIFLVSFNAGEMYPYLDVLVRKAFNL